MRRALFAALALALAAILAFLAGRSVPLPEPPPAPMVVAAPPPPPAPDPTPNLEIAQEAVRDLELERDGVPPPRPASVHDTKRQEARARAFEA